MKFCKLYYNITHTISVSAVVSALGWYYAMTREETI